MVADARAASAWRRWGYRVLPGDLFSYLLHLRPAEWPIMAAHTALGFLLAVGLVPALHGERLGTLVWALVLWVVFLNGGTLAINSEVNKLGLRLEDPARISFIEVLSEQVVSHSQANCVDKQSVVDPECLQLSPGQRG